MDAPLKILLIEDDEVDRTMVRRALKASGVSAEFEEASDAKTGIALLHATPFDCALLDYRLPDADGLEALRRLRQEGITTPVIVLTGQGDEQLAVELMKAGASDYLSKTRLSRDLLNHAVRHAIGLHQANWQARQARVAAEASERHYRFLADSIPQMVFTADAAGRPDYYNSRWHEYTGMTTEQGVGDGWESIVHQDDLAECLGRWKSSIATGRTFETECRLRRYDGAYRWHLGRGEPLRDDAGSVVRWFGTCTDIHDQKQFQDELEEAKNVAEAANAAKDQFLAVLSHELRTPLTPVLSTVQAMESDPALPPGARESIDMIRRNVELEARLIDDLLDLTRVARGKLELDIGPIDAHGCLKDALDICADELHGKGLQFAMELGAASHHVRADGARLQQVFWNLIKNAIKFTPEGGRIAVRSTNPRDGFFRLEVRDTGIGIEPEIRARIFDAFEQGERSITRRFGGLGLGLAISKALVEMQGGSLDAHSDGKNQGSAFVVELPVTVPAPEPARAAPDNGKAAVCKLNILVVDDHEDTARAMRRLLERLGHTISLAGSVESALDASHRQPFDLIISDIGLPDGSGLDLMRRLREQKPLRGIALSGFGMEEDVRKSHDAGFAAHLTKPVNFKKLQDVIRQVASQPG